MHILITGTPGTGKTTFSLYFSEAHDYYYINVNDLAKKYDLFLKYDDRRDSYIINIDRVRGKIRNLLKRNDDVIIDTHIVDAAPKNIDLVIVFRLNPIRLLGILKSRGYSEKKIAENVEAELLGICASDAYRRFHNKVFELDVTDKKPEEIERFIISASKKIVKNQGIEWLTLLNDKDLEELLSYLSKNR
ncbi:MAG: adenylate kinase family protein [Thermoprotei archaeon]